MKVTTQETLYHEDHGAISKHKCGKEIVALSLLPFSLIFFLFSFFLLFFLLPFFFFFLAFLFFLWPFFFSFWPFLFFFRDNALIMMIITLIYLQVMNYNSKLEQDMTLYECLRRCTGICNESRATCMKEL